MSFTKVVGLVLLIILIYDKQTQHQWLRKICTLKKIKDGCHYNKNAYISGTAGAFFIILFLLVKAHPGDNFLLQDKVLNLPWLFFLHIHTHYYNITILCWRFFPVRGSNTCPLKGYVVFSSYAWRCRIRAVSLPPSPPSGLQLQIQGCWLPCWLTSWSQVHQHEYISLHALNPL